MSAPAPKRENLLVNLACNIALPTFVLMKLSGEARLGPLWGLIVALAFPLGYGIYDFMARGKTNFLSGLGVVSVLLTGGLGLMKVGGIWFAVKEASIPALIGAAVLLSLRTKTPLVREMLYNEQIIDIARVDAALTAREAHGAFDRLMTRASLMLAGSFLLSAGLNYALARHFLISPPGTAEFNAELGRMNAWSWLMIALPSMGAMMLAFWRLVSGLGKITGLTTDEIFRGEPEKK